MSSQSPQSMAQPVSEQSSSQSHSPSPQASQSSSSSVSMGQLMSRKSHSPSGSVMSA